MKPCKDCGKEISGSARRCPHCGAYVWHGIEIKAGIFLMALIIFLFWWIDRL
jgi:uncharacterized membrane protein YvbJ